MVDVMVVWVVSDGGGRGGEWVVELAAWWRGDVGWVKMGDVDGVAMVTVEMAWVLWWWDDEDDGDEVAGSWLDRRFSEETEKLSGMSFYIKLLSSPSRENVI
nr:hypothetical protein [Tanacetum cinerariifolium]